MPIEGRRGLISSGHSWVVESVRCESSAGRIVLAPLALGKRKAGRKHARAFGDDMNAGGTDFFLSFEHWTIFERCPFWHGPVSLFGAGCNKNVSF